VCVRVISAGYTITNGGLQIAYLGLFGVYCKQLFVPFLSRRFNKREIKVNKAVWELLRRLRRGTGSVRLLNDSIVLLPRLRKNTENAKYETLRGGVIIKLQLTQTKVDRKIVDDFSNKFAFSSVRCKNNDEIDLLGRLVASQSVMWRAEGSRRKLHFLEKLKGQLSVDGWSSFR